MFDELVKTVLSIVVAFFLKVALAAIGVEIDPILFNTLVAGIVVYLLTLLGYEAARKVAPNSFSTKG